MSGDLEELHEVLEPRHLDAGGAPFCGRPAPGALVVDEPVDVTCAACLLKIAGCLKAALAGGLA